MASNLTLTLDQLAQTGFPESSYNRLRPNLILSNLEPHHTYHVQIAGFNSRGVGPLSPRMEVVPRPANDVDFVSDQAGRDRPTHDALDEAAGGDRGSLAAWLVPTLLCFAIVTGLAAGYVLCSRNPDLRRSVSGGSYPKIRMPAFSSGFFARPVGRRNRPRQGDDPAGQKEFQLLQSPSATSQSQMTGLTGSSSRGGGVGQSPGPLRSAASAETSLNRFGLNKLNNNNRFRRGKSEEESDYAYIDRSTHSITGYLNNPNNELSPYATTEVSPAHEAAAAGRHSMDEALMVAAVNQVRYCFRI